MKASSKSLASFGSIVKLMYRAYHDDSQFPFPIEVSIFGQRFLLQSEIRGKPYSARIA
jgi:hypothetical protein